MSQWTPQQEAIFAQLEGDDPGHIVVRARAGTGKTTSIIEGVTRSREARAGQEVMLCAFNKEIAEELKRRISGTSAAIDVCTSHAAGMRIVRRYWPGTAVDGKRCWKLAEAHLGQAAPDVMVGLVAKLAIKGKELHAGVIALDDLEEHAFEFDLEPSQDWLRDGWTTERVCKAALAVIEASTARDGTIDFADMIRLPLVHNWVHPRYALIVVDEAQDFAVPNLELCERLLAPGGRIVVVGDDRQAVYGFRGADSTALDRLKKKLDAHELGLTVTWRCPRITVDYARTMVPDFQAALNAPEGEAGYCSEAVLPGVAKPGDVILSRTNAPLATACLALLRLGVPARIRGGGELDLPGLVRTLSRGKGVGGLGDFIARLQKWEMREVAKAVQAMERAKHMEAAQRKLQLVRDKAATLEALCEGLTTIHELEARIADIFTVRQAGECVLLSTVHKAKGLEWNRVFLLYETFQGQRGGEEENIEYVAVTRAKSSLVFVGSLPAHFEWLMKVKMRTCMRLSGRPALKLTA